MSKEPSSARSGGVGLFGLIFVLFLGLKLAKIIDWSWWWVFAPLWGPLAIIAAIFIAVASIIFIAGFFGIGDKRR
jgi:hypothetical protein